MRWRLDHSLVEQIVVDEILILSRPLSLEFLELHPPGENDRIHGESIGPEMGVEKVDRKDEACREQSFVAMDYGRHIDERSREYQCEHLGEPEE